MPVNSKKTSKLNKFKKKNIKREPKISVNKTWR